MIDVHIIIPGIDRIAPHRADDLAGRIIAERRRHVIRRVTVIACHRNFHRNFLHFSLVQAWPSGTPMLMLALRHAHLMTMTLQVDFAGMLGIGKTPAGRRRIAPVLGGTFEGEKLAGTVLPGADWVLNRPDGVMLIDVRLTLRTAWESLIYLSYQGRFLADADAMRRFGSGELLAPSAYSLAVVARFECGDDRLAWLNDIVCVGTGIQSETGPIYDFFAVG